MNETVWKRLSLLFWGNILVIIVACAITNSYVFYLLKSQEAAITEKEANNEKLRDQLLEAERTLMTAEEFQKRWRSEDRKVQEMMADCTSRDDFIVRQGPRIAWHPLPKPARQVAKLVLYLPAGKHRLLVATRTRGTAPPQDKQRSPYVYNRYPTREEFLNSHPRHLYKPKRLELGPGAETYEIVLETTDERMRLSVLGKENQIIRETTFPEITGLRFLSLQVPQVCLAYPVEMQLPADSSLGNLLRRQHNRPVTELASATANSPGHVDIRIWIESDSRPCIPAMEVASRIQVSSRHGVRTQAPFLTSDEVRKYCLPYDGGDVLYIREPYFTR